MTDLMPEKKKRRIVLPIIAVIVVLVVAGFIASRAGIDKALVKQKLDHAIAQIKERGKAQGRDIDITYGDLNVVGGLLSRHVVIHNPQMSVKVLNPKPPAPGAAVPPQSLIVSTPVIEVYPEAMDLSALRVQFPQPINFASESAPDKSLMKVSANAPFVISVAQESKNNVPYNHVHYISPTQMDYTYLREQQAKGAEEATPQVVPVYETLKVTVAANSTIDTDFAADGSQLGTAGINFTQLAMVPQSAPQGVVNIAAITGQWSNVLNEKQQNVIHGTFNMGPLTAAAQFIPYAPVSLAVDVTYTGAMLKTPEDVAAVKSQESTIDIKTFSVTTKDASVNATGNFVADASDVLPVGKANIAIVNMPFVLGELRGNGFLSPANEPIIDPLLQQITATPVEQLKDTNIAIERARGGAFKIGQTTFEELFATFLKAALQQRQGAGMTPLPSPVITPGTPSPHAPMLPPAGKPKSKPIPLPDSGARG